MLGERLRLPGRARLRQRDEMRQHPVEIADDVVGEPHRGRDVDRLDVDLQQQRIADPGLVLDLDRVIAEPDDEIGRAQEAALDLSTTALDAAERQRMTVVDQALRHGSRGERQIVALDRFA